MEGFRKGGTTNYVPLNYRLISKKLSPYLKLFKKMSFGSPLLGATDGEVFPNYVKILIFQISTDIKKKNLRYNLTLSLPFDVRCTSSLFDTRLPRHFSQT